MQLHITPGDELPIYRQIMRQVIEAIASAQLEPGSKLPSHRKLASELVIAPLTVKKAYDELELAGYIRVIRGHGTLVCDQAPKLNAKNKNERLRPMVKRLLHEAALLGINLSTVQKILGEENANLKAAREDAHSIKRRK